MAVRFCQINLHHSGVPSAALVKNFKTKNIEVALIQEPYVLNSRIAGLRSEGNLVYFPKGSKPRSCVLVSRNFKYVPLIEFCSGDETAIKLYYKSATGCETEVVVCSAYFPHEESPPSRNLQNLIAFCKYNNLQLIIGCDANAHHTIWGSTDINSRGEQVLEFVVKNDLTVANVGNKPTFANQIRHEVLDLTFATKIVGLNIRNWHVSDEPSLSDHFYIFFNLVASAKQKITFRNPKNLNNSVYLEKLEENLRDLSTQVSYVPEVIDFNANCIQNAIINAYEASCPLRTRNTNRRVPWFTHEVNKLRKDVRRKWNRSRKLVKRGLSIEQAKILTGYREALTSYSNAIAASKKLSWQLKCEEIQNTGELSRIYKFLSKGPTESVGALKRADGSYTENVKDCLSLLLNSHFPDSVPVTEGPNPTVNEVVFNQGDIELAGKIVTPNKVRWALRSFKPYKSPGPDKIFPVLLQQGSELLVPFLCSIFRSSLVTGYIPNSWSKVSAIFIPKPGKANYDEAKSFRAISLMSFILKTLERLIDRFIRDEVLAHSPLHRNQFAYLPGKSTEVALHHLISRLEKFKGGNDIALVAFLDIEGAFDNTSFAAISRSLRRRNVPNSLIRWITSMLNSRTVTASLFDEAVTVRVTKGTPQGGCLSPLLWSLVIDDLLERLNRSGVYAQGYADDICIMVAGKFQGTISELLQNALKLTERWCLDEDLSINPNKSVVVPFTTKRILNDLKCPRLFGKVISFSNEVKYLGIILDGKLSWTPHLNHVIAKGKRSFWACRNIVGKTWGVQPNRILWVYESIICPRVTNGSIVWWSKTTTDTAKKQLGSIQRLAELAITGCMKTTPSMALDAFLAIPPLHLRIESVARLTAIRMASLNLWNDFNLGSGHLSLNTFLKGNSSLWKNSDRILPQFCFERNFEVCIQSREFWNEQLAAPSPPDTEVWYTDGSKSDEGTGSGIYCEDPEVSIAINVGISASVFQAEAYAIKHLCSVCLLKDYQNKKILIYSDSQSTLQSLCRFEFKSQTIWDLYLALQELSQRNTVCLSWIPGHNGFVGNEMVDALAKEGCTTNDLTVELKNSPNSAKLHVKALMYAQHKKLWRTYERARTSKLFCPTIDVNRSKVLLSLKRNDLRVLIGLFTGHCLLNDFMTKINVANNSICRFCLEENETSSHLLCECPALNGVRNRFLNSYVCGPSKVVVTDPRILLKFTEASGISKLILSR
jgi:ribonuclease HI